MNVVYYLFVEVSCHCWNKEPSLLFLETKRICK